MQFVVVSLKGGLLSESPTGLDQLIRYRDALEGLLFPERGKSVAARRVALAPVTFPQRTDIAADFGVRGGGTGPYLARFVSHNERAERVAHWVLPGAPKHPDIMPYDETGTAVRHARLGIRIYDKRERLSTVLQGCVEQGWATAGWTERDGVIRVELRLNRGWINAQTRDGIEGKALTLDAFLGSLRGLAKKLTRSHRLLAKPKYEYTNVSRTPIAPLWQLAQKHLGKVPGLRKARASSFAPADLSARTQQAGRKMRVDLQRALSRLLAAGSDDGGPLPETEVRRVALDALREAVAHAHTKAAS